jgi:hypothetical protein
MFKIALPSKAMATTGFAKACASQRIHTLQAVKEKLKIALGEEKMALYWVRLCPFVLVKAQTCVAPNSAAIRNSTETSVRCSRHSVFNSLWCAAHLARFLPFLARFRTTTDRTFCRPSHHVVMATRCSLLQQADFKLFVSQKMAKKEWDKRASEHLGPLNIGLHNEFVMSVFVGARMAHAPPPAQARAKPGQTASPPNLPK